MSEDTSEAVTCEVAIYRDCAINIPLTLYSNKNILAAVLNYETWAHLLNDEERDHLRQYLPHFPCQDSYHLQEETVRKLLNGRNFKFGNPVYLFHRKLQLGHFNPRIAELLAVEQQALYIRYKLHRQKYYKDLLSDALSGRQKALRNAIHSVTDNLEVLNQPNHFSQREVALQQSAQREYEKVWLSVKISTQDYSNSSDEDETFEDRLNQHKSTPETDKLCLKDMLTDYRKRRNSHILYPDLITDKVTLLSVRHRVEKKRRRSNR